MSVRNLVLAILALLLTTAACRAEKTVAASTKNVRSAVWGFELTCPAPLPAVP